MQHWCGGSSVLRICADEDSMDCFFFGMRIVLWHVLTLFSSNDSHFVVNAFVKAAPLSRAAAQYHRSEILCLLLRVFLCENEVALVGHVTSTA